MKTELLKDINENEYVGIKLPIDTKGIFSMLIEKCKSFIPLNDFHEFNTNLLKRNHFSYHITVFNVMECFKNPYLLNFVNLDINDLVITGLGTISKFNNKTALSDETFFITVESKEIDKMLMDNLNITKDLHITIAFNNKDLFHARKLPNIISTKL